MFHTPVCVQSQWTSSYNYAISIHASMSACALAWSLSPFLSSSKTLLKLCCFIAGLQLTEMACQKWQTKLITIKVTIRQFDR